MMYYKPNNAADFLSQCQKYWKLGTDIDKAIETTDGEFVRANRWTKPVAESLKLQEVEITGDVIEPQTFESFEI